VHRTNKTYKNSKIGGEVFQPKLVRPYNINTATTFANVDVSPAEREVKSSAISSSKPINDT